LIAHQKIRIQIRIRRILIYKICIRWKWISAGSVTSLLHCQHVDDTRRSS